MYDVIIIGGGAAGFFCAANLKNKKVLLLEKTGKLLSKVLVSGGGRCNVTHHCFDPATLASRYPRGHKELRGLFSRFQAMDTIKWFKQRGVNLKTEPDGRMFPESNSSETIANLLLEEATKNGCSIRLQSQVRKLWFDKHWHIELTDSTHLESKKVLVASGGMNKPDQFAWIHKLGLNLIPSVPSLFTFHLTDMELKELTGLSMPNAMIQVSGIKKIFTGPILITHWGISGPAVLKASAWAAPLLAETNYMTTVRINWLGESFDLRKWMADQSKNKSFIINLKPQEIPQRLWSYFIFKAGLLEEKPWNEVGPKQKEKIAQTILAWEGIMNGKTTFKEEFVTAGGVDLKEVDPKTMESKKWPGLYFSGEVINVDGETGGFNFQNAWTGSWLVAESMNQK